EGHRAGARHAPEGGPQAGKPAAGAGADGAPEGLAADGEGNEPGRDRRCRSRARATRALLQEPGVAGAAAEPDVVERERTERQLRRQNAAGGPEPGDDGRVLLRHAVAEGLGAPGGADARGVEEVLHPEGDAVQGAAVLPPRDLPVRRLGIGERLLPDEGDGAV